MSLSPAPLGQLPSMSMPYSIPNQYARPPSIWQQALATLLTNAAGTAADRGVANVMSHDNAAEFGQTPRSGFGRLFDPVVGDKEAAQLREQKFTGGEAAKTRTFQAGELQSRLDAEAAQQEAAARNAQLLEEQRLQGGQDTQLLSDLNAQQRLGQSLVGEQDLARTKAALEAKNPENIARTGLYTKEGQHYESQSAFTNQLLDRIAHPEKYDPKSKANTGGPVVSDADRAAMGQLRAGNGAPSVVNPFTGSGADASTYTSGLSDVQALLAQGVPVEQIPAIVQRQQAVNTRAQAMPAGSTTPAVDPRLQALLQQLGMTSSPSAYSTPDIFN